MNYYRYPVPCILGIEKLTAELSPFSFGIDVEDMRLAGKDRLFTHSIRLDCHLASPLTCSNFPCKKAIK